jgi:hypothetical protein
MSTERRYAVDRLDAGTVVLVDDDGRSTALPKSRFCLALEEGMILFVPIDGSGTPDWYAARGDHAAADEITQETQGDLDELQRRDPGGDVEL